MPSGEARVLQLRLGLTDGRSHTLKKVGGKFGVMRERIRQIETEDRGGCATPAAAAGSKTTSAEPKRRVKTEERAIQYGWSCSSCVLVAQYRQQVHQIREVRDCQPQDLAFYQAYYGYQHFMGVPPGVCK